MVNKKDRLEIELVLKDLITGPLKKLGKEVETLARSLKGLQDAFKSAVTDIRGLGRAASAASAGMAKLKAAQAGLSAQVRGTARSFATFKKNLQESSAGLRSMARASASLGRAMERLEALSQRLEAQERHNTATLRQQTIAYQRLAQAAQAAAAARQRSAQAPQAARGAGRNLWTGQPELTRGQLRELQIAAQLRNLRQGVASSGIGRAIDRIRRLRSDLSGLSQNELRQLESRLHMVQLRSQQTSGSIAQNIKRLRALRSPIDRSAQALSHFHARWKALLKSWKEGNLEANRISFTFRRLFGILAAFAAARYAAAGFFGLVRGSVEFNANLEQSRIGLASLFMATSQITDMQGRLVKEAERLPAALHEADRQIQQLRIDALKSTATFQQLVQTYQIAIAPGIQAGLDPNQIRKFALRISQAAAAIGLPMNQLAEEIRSTLAGTIQMRTTRIAAALGITNEDIRNAKKAGKLYEFLQKKFDAFAKTQGLAATTFHGLTQRLKDFSEIVAGIAGQSFFKRLKGYLADIIKSGLQLRNGVLQPSEEVVGAFRLIFEQLELILRDLHDVGTGKFLQGFAKVITLLLQVGKLIAHYFVGGFKAAFQMLDLMASVLRPITLLVRQTGIEFKYVVQALGFIVIGQKLAVFAALRFKKIWDTLKIVTSEVKTIVTALRNLDYAKVWNNAKDALVKFRVALVATSKEAARLAKASALGFINMLKSIKSIKLSVLVVGFKKLIDVIRHGQIGIKAFSLGLLGIVGAAALVNEAVQAIKGTNYSITYQMVYAWNFVKATFEAVAAAITAGIAGLALGIGRLLNKLGLVSDAALKRAQQRANEVLKQWEATKDIIANTNKAMNEFDKVQQNVVAHAEQQRNRFLRQQQEVLQRQQLFNMELERTKNLTEAWANTQKAALIGTLDKSFVIEKKMQILYKQRQVAEEALEKQRTKAVADLQAQNATAKQIAATYDSWNAKIKAFRAETKLQMTELQFQKDQTKLNEELSIRRAVHTFRLKKLEREHTLKSLEAERTNADKLAIINEQISFLETSRSEKLKEIADRYQRQQKFLEEHGASERELNKLALERAVSEASVNDVYEKQLEKLKAIQEVYAGGLPAAAENGLKLFAKQYGDEIKAISDLTRQATEKLADFISNAITDAFDPTKNKPIKERFGEFLQELGRMLIQFAIKMAIAKAITAALGGGGVPLTAPGTAWEGGSTDRFRNRNIGPSLGHALAPGFAGGGAPRGARHPEDTIPIWVAPGEYILRRTAVQKYGIQALNALNLGLVQPDLLKGFRSYRSFSRGPGFAEGGPVPAKVSDSAEPAKTQAEAATVTPAVVVASDETMERLLAGGKGAFLRFMQQHSSKIKEMLR